MGTETILIAAMIAAVAAASASAYGTMQQGKAARRQGEFNASVERSNALQQQADANFAASAHEANRKEALLDASLQRSKIEEESRRRMAGTTAGAARAGLDIGSTSLKDVLMQEALAGEYEGQLTMFDAQRKAVGLGVEARKARQTGDRFRTLGYASAENTAAAGREAYSSSKWGAGAELMSGAAQAGGMYAGYFG